MSWKAEAHQVYEARVLADSLAGLARNVDVKQLPFSDEELQTLVNFARLMARRSCGEFRRRSRKSTMKSVMRKNSAPRKMAVIMHIFAAPKPGAAMQSLESVEALANAGLAGDRYAGHQVMLIEEYRDARDPAERG